MNKWSSNLFCYLFKIIVDILNIVVSIDFMINESIKEKVDPEVMASKFCEHFGYDLEAVRGDARPESFVLCRDMISYFLRTKKGMPYKDISLLMGRTNHSTALHQHKKCESMIAAKDELYTSTLSDLETVYNEL